MRAGNHIRLGRVFLKEERAMEKPYVQENEEGAYEVHQNSSSLFSMERPLEGSLRNPSLDYITFGMGERVAIFLPGIDIHSVWDGAMSHYNTLKALEREYQVYCFDKTSPLKEDVTMEALGEDLSKAMDILGLPRADVIGISMGGMIAQYLALNHPEKVQRMVLSFTACRGREEITQVTNQWASLAREQGLRAAFVDLFSHCYSPEFQARFGKGIDFLMGMNSCITPERFSMLAKVIATMDTYDRLPELTCQTLVLGAQRDKVVGPNAAGELAQRLGCESYIFPEGAHCVFVERGKDYARRVLAFLQ